MYLQRQKRIESCNNMEGLIKCSITFCDGNLKSVPIMNIEHLPYSKMCGVFNQEAPDYHTFMGILELMTVVTIYYDGDLGYESMQL